MHLVKKFLLNNLIVNSNKSRTISLPIGKFGGNQIIADSSGKCSESAT